MSSTIVEIPPTPSSTADAHAPTPVTNALAIALPLTFLLTSVTSASTSLLAAFGMVPVNTFMRHSYLWNIITHPLVETNVLLLALNLLVVISVLRPLEREVSRSKLLGLFAFTTLSISGGLMFVTPMLSAAFNAPFTSASFCGFAPLSVAVLIASWQRFGDVVIAAAGDSISLRSRHLPVLAAFLCCVIDLIAGPGAPENEEISAGLVPVGSYSVTVVIGLIAAWFYLRFIAVPTGQQQAGDMSAAFAFHELFPGPFKVLAKAAGQLMWPLVRCCGYGAGVQTAPVAAASQAQAPVVTSVKAPNTVADRRRQVALAALSQRLERARQLEQDSAASAAAEPTGDKTSAV